MNINLEHTVDEVNMIIKALEEMPHKLVHALLVKIHNQAIPQANVAAPQVSEQPVADAILVETETQ
jgi:hypothetical protein